MGNKEELMQQAANFGEWEYGPIKVGYMLCQDTLGTNIGILYGKANSQKKRAFHACKRAQRLSRRRTRCISSAFTIVTPYEKESQCNSFQVSLAFCPRACLGNQVIQVIASRCDVNTKAQNSK
jgi:hypothetical protein